jgi:hypothetical protein
MAVSREVLESPVYQSPNEKLAYTITTTPWGSAPASITITNTDVTDSDNPVSAPTTLSGAASVAGDVITTKFVYQLTQSHNYRLSVLFTDALLNIWEAYLIIYCR